MSPYFTCSISQYRYHTGSRLSLSYSKHSIFPLTIVRGLHINDRFFLFPFFLSFLLSFFPSFFPSFFLSTSIIVPRFCFLFRFTVDSGKTPSSLSPHNTCVRACVHASIFCFCLSLIAFLFLVLVLVFGFFLSSSPWGREIQVTQIMAFSCIHVYVLYMGI